MITSRRRTTLRAMATALALLVGAPALVASSGDATMKAVRMHEYGDASVLIYEDAPRPEISDNQILVRVHAAGVNPVDWKLRSGMIKLPGAALPSIPGFDISGVVEQVGPAVTRFKAGDEVYAYLGVPRGGGAYAQFAAVPEADAALKPASLDHAHAAAVPLAALTAWQALVDKAQIKPGDTVLIHGAAGGVGHFAVQIAKAKGARVIATASERNLEFVKGLGADVVVDYRAQRFEDFAKDVDIVLDPIGGETQARSFEVIKPGGILVSIVQPPDAAKLEEHKIRGAGFLVAPSGAELAALTALIDAGAVRPDVCATFPLDKAADAHRASEEGVDHGKIVLLVP